MTTYYLTRRISFSLLKVHEDVKRQAYVDCCGRYWKDCTCNPKGNLTIAIGRNLDNPGLRDEEVLYLFESDWRLNYEQLHKLSWFYNLDGIRQAVLLDMAFMGVDKLLGFERMIAALEKHDYQAASYEMVNSKWATQVGVRAADLSYIMRNGSPPKHLRFIWAEAGLPVG